MDRRKGETDEKYWAAAQKGFDFDDIDLQFRGLRLPTSKQNNDDMSKYDMLRCNGLSDVAENGSFEDTLTCHVVYWEEDKAAQKVAKNFDPLQLNAKLDGTLPKSAVSTIRNMVFGLEYSLESFKGKEEKIELLNEAVKSHDGNVILAVILFLKITLKSSIFQREIVKFPCAVNVYLSYLEEFHEVEELANMLLLLERPEDAAILKYQAAVIVKNPERKLKWIENCLSTHFHQSSVDSFLWKSVAEHKQLLEEQIYIQNYYFETTPKENYNLQCFEKLTGLLLVVDSSVLCSLIFCCLYYYGSVEPKFINPSYIKSQYSLSNKQYTWAVVRALAANEKWAGLEDLFTNKSWLGGIKMKSCIGFSKVLDVLTKAKAPNEILKKYVCFVENEEEKLALAKKCQCHSVVIEILKNNRDRLGLLEYKAILPQHSIDFYTASNVLNNNMIRWRN